MLSASQRTALLQYKYSGVDNSLVSRFLLQPWWNWLVKRFPLWVAPNLITLAGFLLVVANVLLMFYYSPDLSTPCPQWVYFSFAIGLFIYQSFDAIDGKQARRTGASSPLGELFDHGCDALNTTLITLLGASAMNQHQSGYIIVAALTTLTNFYISTWEEYHTHTLFLSYCSGPVEGLLIGVLIFAMAGAFGPGLYDLPFKTLWKLDTILPPAIHSFISDTMPLKDFVVYFGAVFCILNVLASFWNIRTSSNTHHTSLIKPFIRLAPLAFWMSLFIRWSTLTPTMVSQHALGLVCLFGTVLGYTVGQIIFAHLTKSPFPMFRNFLLNVWAPFGLSLTYATKWFLAGELNAFADAETGQINTLNLIVKLTHAESWVAPLCPDYQSYILSSGITTIPAHLHSYLTYLTESFLPGLKLILLNNPTPFHWISDSFDIYGLIIWGMFWGALVFYLVWAYRVVDAFCDVLNIHAFKLGPRVVVTNANSNGNLKK